MFAQRSYGQADHAGRLHPREHGVPQRRVGSERRLFARVGSEPRQRIDAERRELLRPRQRGADGEIGGPVLQRAEFAARGRAVQASIPDTA